MPARRSLAASTARGLWLQAAPGGDESGLVVAADRVVGQLSTGLGRWIGAEGYRALLARALVTLQPEHPVLGTLLDRDAPRLRDAAPRVIGHGAEAVSAGMVALLAELIDLLARVIGEDMAVRLVTHAVQPDAPGEASAGVHGGRNA